MKNKINCYIEAGETVIFKHDGLAFVKSSMGYVITDGWLTNWIMVRVRVERNLRVNGPLMGLFILRVIVAL